MFGVNLLVNCLVVFCVVIIWLGLMLVVCIDCDMLIINIIIVWLWGIWMLCVGLVIVMVNSSSDNISRIVGICC